MNLRNREFSLTRLSDITIPKSQAEEMVRKMIEEIKLFKTHADWNNERSQGYISAMERSIKLIITIAKENGVDVSE